MSPSAAARAASNGPRPGFLWKSRSGADLHGAASENRTPDLFITSEQRSCCRVSLHVAEMLVFVRRMAQCIVGLHRATPGDAALSGVRLRCTNGKVIVSQVGRPAGSGKGSTIRLANGRFRAQRTVSDQWGSTKRIEAVAATKTKRSRG